MANPLPTLRLIAFSVRMVLCAPLTLPAMAQPVCFGDPDLDATMDKLVQRLDRRLVSSGSLSPDQRREAFQ